MKRALLIIGALLLSFGAGALTPGLLAAPATVVYMPVMRTAQQPALIRLVESDTTFVSAARDESTGRIFVNYIDRQHGNKLRLTELINDRLIPLAAPPAAVAALLAAQAPGPSFTPNSPKDADSATLAWDGWEHVFFSARPPDDPTGPFQLWYWRWQP